MSNLKDIFRGYFYSPYTEYQIKNMLGLSNSEYQSLLKDAKEYFDLPLSYRRQPSLYDKYSKNNYFLLSHDLKKDDYSILLYRPTYELVESELENISLKKDFNYSIHKVDDDFFIELIGFLYYEKKDNWESIIQKLNMPYHKFYFLLSKVKRNSSNSNRDSRFIYKYKRNGSYVILKTVNNKRVNFGYYPDIDTARKMRDYLESIDWDIEEFHENKKKNVRVLS